MKLAAVLLLMWWAVHYGFRFAPADLQGATFNIMRSAASIVLVGMLLLAMPSRFAAITGAGLMAEDAQVVGCGIWWMLDPWPTTPGGELCSDKLGIPLGAIGLAILGTVAWHLKKKQEAPNA